MTRGTGLAPRLFLAQLGVVIAGFLSLVLLSFVVAPPLFTAHLRRAGESDPLVRHHADTAFDAALGIALLLATPIALAAAAAVSLVLVRRLTGPVSELARQADAVATGDYTVGVADPRLGPEFARLTGAFAHMADRLSHTETVRRRLMSDLAHELRTPVHTLRAHVDGLEDGVVAADPATWQVMRDQLDRLQRLGTDLAELSAAEEHTLDLDLQPADLVVIAAAAVDAAALQHQAKGVALRLRGRDDLPVLADAVRLQQVLGNLLDNALRHTRAGGAVEVVTARDRDHAVIDVVDTGDGIPAEEIDAIFDRFHRLDAARSRADGGSGLGLTIARAIVTDHHGALTVRSDGPGKGATFTIRLPLRT